MTPPRQTVWRLGCLALTFDKLRRAGGPIRRRPTDFGRLNPNQISRGFWRPGALKFRHGPAALPSFTQERPGLLICNATAGPGREAVRTTGVADSTTARRHAWKLATWFLFPASEEIPLRSRARSLLLVPLECAPRVRKASSAVQPYSHALPDRRPRRRWNRPLVSGLLPRAVAGLLSLSPPTPLKVPQRR
jgi:hypothetical protein